jgi:hypothetical protein
VTTALYPPAIALVRLSIAGFASLSAEEQTRAAAFALKRDLGVDAAGLQLAAKSVRATTDDVAIAFTSAAGPCAVPTHYLDAMSGDTIEWFHAPTGYAIGPSGAVTVERAATTEGELPNEILSMLTQRNAVRSLSIVSPGATISAETIAMWQAATGVSMSVAKRAPDLEGALLPLRAPAKSTVMQANTALDRSLIAACCASALCVLSAISYTWVSQGRSSALADESNAATTGVTMKPGELFTRITTIAPDLTALTQTATYGGGAWIIGLARTATPELLERQANALKSNGLAVQTITEPELRLRVNAP